ncbi:MAG TPA: DUF6798 domain-containing protein [Saprospiraceae bacterium]|nr:DUF6798 domain-containing protein [Saprospiraceae bacterium]
MYEIGVEKFHLMSMLYTQWWKTTIWMEAFAFVAIGYHLERLFSAKSFVVRYPVLALLGLLAFASVVKLSGIRPSKPPYMFPWSGQHSEEVDISIQANASTPENALFIVPVEFTAFRWYSKRSTYIDYKAMLHQETFLKDWYDRMQSIYQYGIKEKEGGFDLHHFSQYLLEDPSPLSIEYWKKLGITHIISTNLDLKTLTQVAHNGQFAIYKL